MKKKYLTFAAFLLVPGLSHAGLTQIDPDFMLFADQDMPVGYCGVYHGILDLADPDQVCVYCSLEPIDSLFASQWCGETVKWDTGVDTASGVVTITKNKKGNPVPGRFPYKGYFMEYDNDVNGLANYNGCPMFFPMYDSSICKSAAEACGSGETGPIAVAIHADIYNYYEGTPETAWLAECLAFGPDGYCQEWGYDFGGRSWATYIHVPCRTDLPGICRDGLLSCGAEGVECVSIQNAEEICDGQDNNCDGEIDEGFPNLGDDCSPGIGECQNFGQYVCTPDGSGTECNVVAGDPPENPEVSCADGRDNDCDGLTDDADSDDCFLDSDGDGVPDADDICPGHDDNLDYDGDGVPNGCDACPGADDNLDADGDGVPDACDVCPAGDDNLDADGDTVPDACDVCPGADDYADADGDGVPDVCDNCVDIYNPYQDDDDGNGVGDACEVGCCENECYPVEYIDDFYGYWTGGEGNGQDDDGDGVIDEGCYAEYCNTDDDCFSGLYCAGEGQCLYEDN